MDPNGIHIKDQIDELKKGHLTGDHHRSLGYELKKVQKLYGGDIGVKESSENSMNLKQ